MADPTDDDRLMPGGTPDRDYDTMAQAPAGHDASARPKVPATLPPRGACDTHLTLLGTDGTDAAIQRLRTQMATLEMDRGVVLAPATAHTGEPDLLNAALRALGPSYRGIAAATGDLTDAALDRMAEAGIVALWLDERAEALSWDDARALAPRLHMRGMHLDIRLVGPLAERADTIAGLGCPAVLLSDGIDDAQALHPLMDRHGTFLKITRAEPSQAGLPAERCLWGSCGPYTIEDAQEDAGQRLDAFFDQVPDADARHAILVANPARLYGFQSL